MQIPTPVDIEIGYEGYMVYVNCVKGKIVAIKECD
jgi:hypothetical protein